MRSYPGISGSLSVCTLCALVFLLPVGGGPGVPPAAVIAPTDRACTSAVVVNNGTAVIGSNYDSGWTGGLIFLNKREIRKSNRYMELGNPNGTVIEWTSKYASLVFVVGSYQFPWAGMNERGLAYGTMAHHPVHTDPADPRAHMESSYWWQYVLDTCETVEEVVAAAPRVKLETVDHFLFTDRYGHSGVLEFDDDGEMVFTTGANLPIAVLTNNNYGDNRDLWNSIKHSSDTYPTLDDSVSRFMRAADMVDDFRSGDDAHGVNYVFSILSKCGWEPSRRSMWSIVSDSRNLQMHYNTIPDARLKTIDLLGFDLGGKYPTKMMDVHNTGSGNVTSSFADLDWGEVEANARGYWQWEGVTVPEDAVALVIDMIKNFPWTGDAKAEGAPVTNAGKIIVDEIRCALNPVNGFVLVTWIESGADTPSIRQVKSAVLFPTLDGTYCAAEHHTLSSGNGYSGAAVPAYLASRNRFMVVWDQADPLNPTAKSAILARIISASGFPETPVLALVKAKDRNQAPQVFERFGSSGGSKQSASVDLVYFTSKAGKVELTNAALKLAPISATYTAGKSVTLLKPGSGSIADGRYLPTGTGVVHGDTIFLTVNNSLPYPSFVQGDRLLVCAINGKNRVADLEQIGSGGEMEPNLALFTDSSGDAQLLGASISPNGTVTDTLFSTTDDGGELTFDNRSTERFKAVSAVPLSLSVLPAGVNTPAQSAVGHQFLASTKGAIYRRAIGADGLPEGKYIKVVKSAKGLAGLTATLAYREAPGANGGPGSERKSLLIWFAISTQGETVIRSLYSSLP